MDKTAEDDIKAIEALIARQFGSMSWRHGGGPNVETFRSDFLPGALLYPSARPVKAQSISDFADRMKGLASGSLISFDEQVLGSSIKVFGNIAVAIVACENTENESDVNRNVEMMLLVKGGRQWKIVAQAWDKASDSLPMPEELVGHGK